MLSRAITPDEVIAWSDPTPTSWIGESIALRNTIYPANTNISWDYAYQHRDEMDDRLKRGGIRIASYLNWLFEQSMSSASAGRKDMPRGTYQAIARHLDAILNPRPLQ